MSKTRRVVFVCCDGLGRNWIDPHITPILHDVAQQGLWCDDHRAVFPSVTRVSAASITTGCHPARHGLHGNRMGLIEDGRIVVRDVGQPDFRSHMRRATGGTLRVPSLAERVRDAGGFIAFSNVSPGAAYFLDPEHFGHVYHRAGSYGPGGAALSPPDALEVSHDLAGDRAMTERFCSEVLEDKRPAVAVLWLANPDHTLHGVPLGSPAHLEALLEIERCVRQVIQCVQRLRQQGEELLLLIGSDHGQETIGDCIDVGQWLAEQGLSGWLESGDVAVAGQGTAALLYANECAQEALLDVLGTMSCTAWAAEVVVGEALARHGFAPRGGVVAAVNMARRDTRNPHGVAGQRWVAAEPGKPTPIGSGQHGGWGADETRPFLIANDDGRTVGLVGRSTCLVDIAPTMIRFLGLPVEGFDGSPLPLD
jgi:arylsulfatase A-like enzyme